MDEYYIDSNGKADNNPSETLWSAVGSLYLWRRFILGVAFVAAIVVAGISLLIPNWYAASARVLAPEATGTNAISAALLKNLPSAASSMLGGKGGDYARYLTILSSRRVLDDVVTKYDLVKVYEIEKDSPAKEKAEAIKLLTDNVEFKVDEEYEFLGVVVMDPDPQRAADMANYFVERLNSINAELATQSAGSYRMYVEKRYDESRKNLDSLLDVTQEFQKKYGLYDVTAQLEAFFTQMAEMKAGAVETQLQYEALRAQLGPENSQVQALKQLVEASDRQYQKALQGQEELLPVSQENMSGVMRQYLGLQRDVLIQGRILEVIGPLLEQARLDEERKVEAVQVVDKAVPPVKKAWPKRSIIVITATLSALLLAVMYVLTYEWWKRNHSRIAIRLNEAATRPAVPQRMS